ncbi:hypothetical protein [Kibdelosporangium phytohabitans]|uniref:Uncharacterized protein n=1 Tax=Kibdelosporangium phytohabitans TaxID=860235 RepID=A0A0N9HW22_9PSEU|nr:hypothetical protein [Kibdelosporangium phytohabitans]ALG07665.1 hypothetical protein AOZ06_12780 [Kibdelosporangium phytohabitans]ALG07721.1 hypothetical protein AOZ06_13100 [Kibdelosporangium phytohabitans]MBE1471375.1 hypothetical protein [Kibdelosporangium phytohabitans]
MATHPTPSGAKSPTLRTLAQNAALDALLAVLLVVLPAIQATDVEWWPLLISVGKTAAATVLTGVLHWARARRATS